MCNTQWQTNKSKSLAAAPVSAFYARKTIRRHFCSVFCPLRIILLLLWSRRQRKTTQTTRYGRLCRLFIALFSIIVLADVSRHDTHQISANQSQLISQTKRKHKIKQNACKTHKFDAAQFRRIYHALSLTILPMQLWIWKWTNFRCKCAPLIHALLWNLRVFFPFNSFLNYEINRLNNFEKCINCFRANVRCVRKIEIAQTKKKREPTTKQNDWALTLKGKRPTPPTHHPSTI